jgi:hypothetical protein
MISILKKYIRKLLPRKFIFLINVIRNRRLKEYFTYKKQYNIDKKYSVSDFPIYLSIAAIVKNEVPYIGEWIEYHLLTGVQKFYIYDNESTDNLKEYLTPYIKDGIVEYINFPGIRQQVAVYNDAVHRYRYSSFWLAFIDIDEFLLPVTGTLTDFLLDFEDVPGIEINQVLYGSGGHKEKPEGLVIECFKDHSNYDIYNNRAIKTIVNPRKVFYIKTAHEAIYFKGEFSYNSNKVKNILPSLNRMACHDKIMINHYNIKSLEEFLSKASRGRAASPGKLTIDNFYERDYNEIKNNNNMEKYVQAVKDNIKLRFSEHSLLENEYR